MAEVSVGTSSVTEEIGLCELPNMLMVLDKSGSMGGTKWTDAKNAVNYVANHYNTDLRFGLELFSSASSGQQDAFVPYVAGFGSCQIPTTPAIIQGALNHYSPGGQTMMVPAMNVAKGELSRSIHADHLAQIFGRRQAVLFITDGAPTDSCPVSQVAALRSLTIEGQLYDVRTYVVGFGTGIDRNCLNALANAGGTSRCNTPGCDQFYVASDNASLTAAMNTVVQITAQEICNGLDDDCDNEIDEGFDVGQSCTVGEGACARSGVMMCNASGSDVECSVIPGSPTIEICDGIDNDCDGAVDEESPELGQSCQVGVGDCLAFGSLMCSPDGSGVMCSAVAGTPVPELCDGRDNNCNGSTDEDFPAKGQPCSVGVGECVRWDVFVCGADGMGVVCAAIPGEPQVEICDAKDNDCDGAVDEGGVCNRPPVAQCRDAVVDLDANGQATIQPATVDNGSFDPDGDALQFSLDRTQFACTDVGTQSVQLTVADPYLETDSCQANVVVRDVTAPVISQVVADPSILWAPNHKMVPVTVSVNATDNCGAAQGATCRIINVSSNELLNGKGDGNTNTDWEITGPLTVNLRAERSNRNTGRIYTIQVSCADQANNASVSQVTVAVPHNR